MRLRYALIALLVIVGGKVASAAAPTTILFDTFQDDMVGQPYGGPDIGVASFLEGDHLVVDVGGGDHALQSNNPSATTSGYTLILIPTTTAERAEIRFRAAVSSGAVLSGANAFLEEVTIYPIPHGVSVLWTDQQTFVVKYWNPAGNQYLDPGISWSFDQMYDFAVVVDGVANTFSVWIDGVNLYHDVSFGDDITGLGYVSLSSNFDTSGLHLLDDLVVRTGTDVFDDGFESGNLAGWSSSSSP